MVNPIYLNSPYSAAAQAMYAPRQMAAPQAQQMGYSQDASSEPTELEQQLQAQQAYAQQNQQQGLNPLQRFWNNLPSWAQWTVGIAGTALTAWGGSKAIKHLPSVPGKIQNFFRQAPLGSKDLKNAHIEHEKAVRQRESSEASYQASQKTLDNHEISLQNVNLELENLGFWERQPLIGRLFCIGNVDKQQERQQLLERAKIVKQTRNEAQRAHQEIQDQYLSHLVIEHEVRARKIETELNLLKEKLPKIQEQADQCKDVEEQNKMDVKIRYVNERIEALGQDLATTRVHLSYAKQGAWPPTEASYPFVSEADTKHKEFVAETNYTPAEPGWFGNIMSFFTGGHDWTEHPMQTYRPAVTAAA